MMKQKCDGCPMNGMTCRGQKPGWGNVCGMRETLGDTWVVAASKADADGPTLESAPLVPLAAPLPRERPVVTAPGGCGSCGSSVETDQRMPPIAVQAANYGRAWAKHVANGLKILEPESVAERLAACNACPFLSPDRRCYKCGCPADKKATWESEDCEEGRWPSRRG